jgi:exodeoxyribonuclease VIII
MNTHHVMLDLETLGKKPGCPIVSIGATTFLTRTPKFFYQVIQLGQARMNPPNPDTMAWWATKSEEAREEIFDNPNAIHISDALQDFVDWLIDLKTSPEDRIVIWGKGATFDEPILLEAMRRYDVNCPWTFRDSMCFRTLADIGNMFGVNEPERIGTKHNALHDAEHQAQWAEEIFKVLYPGKIFYEPNI